MLATISRSKRAAFSPRSDPATGSKVMAQLPATWLSNYHHAPDPRPATHLERTHLLPLDSTGTYSLATLSPTWNELTCCAEIQLKRIRLLPKTHLERTHVLPWDRTGKYSLICYLKSHLEQSHLLPLDPTGTYSLAALRPTWKLLTCCSKNHLESTVLLPWDPPVRYSLADLRPIWKVFTCCPETHRECIYYLF